MCIRDRSQASNHALGHAGDDPVLARRGVHQAQYRQAVFVHRERQRLAVRRQGELLDIPLDVSRERLEGRLRLCLLYTSDAADERSSVDLGGRRIIKKKKESAPHSE